MRATVRKIQEAPVVGEYKKTSVDIDKDSADILIQYALGGKFQVVSKIELSGQGIQKVGQSYVVTAKALEKLQKSYNVQCDF